jgi:glycosyltransferase involved in cell wall biosynthesis
MHGITRMRKRYYQEKLNWMDKEKWLQNNKRLRLGILFYFSPSWMGGIIYITNLIKILDFLDDDNKPEIILFYKPDLRKFVDEISYPYLKAIEWHYPSEYKGYIRSWIFRKNNFVDDILKQYDLNGLYPLHDYPVRTKTKTKLVCWYADLQHKYYPDFFSWRKILERNARIRFMLRNSNDLVVSSQAVADDFAKFFRLKRNLKIHIFHFVSVVNDLNGTSINELRSKYKLPVRYFMISNQFYKHKNHKILFQALALLKEKGIVVYLALTGRFPEKTQSPYINELHELIELYQLSDQISFLGVIPRPEQLLLMKHSQAVIQPTLFEGWSTVIEDAISLQVPVIASNLTVNIEQLGRDGVYFKPDDPSELASILVNYPQRNMEAILYAEYPRRIKHAAEVFINIFS